MEDEVVIVILPDGTMTVNACSACVLGEKDDKCRPEVTSFLGALVQEGHVASVQDPQEVA